jgi:hypothetical protein
VEDVEMKIYGRLLCALCALALCLIVMNGCALFTTEFNEATIGIERGQTFYNRVNLKTYEENKIWYSNYYQGGILIPAGTQCTIVDVTKKGITFTVQNKVYYLGRWLSEKNPDVGRVSFKKYFVADRAMVGLDKINPLFSDSVLSGIAETGMSKDEVLLCLGYPAYLVGKEPANGFDRDFIMSQNDWYYLKDGDKQVLLRFKGNTLFRILE